jgi:hypothetical protein
MVCSNYGFCKKWKIAALPVLNENTSLKPGEMNIIWNAEQLIESFIQESVASEYSVLTLTVVR